jgi:branched-chain amino acid transport system ATP-binding protein
MNQSHATVNAQPLLEIENLHAAYGRAEVLHGLTLQAQKGSVVTVIGPNGAGKSTLLNAIMGILPAQGILKFQGQSIGELTLEEKVMAGISLVPEKRELFASMTVEDNLLLGGFRQIRLKNSNTRQSIEEVYQLFPRLKQRRLQTAGTLSGGERQMLAVGRALMAKPKLLMLDEPSLGLAPLIVKEIFAIIETLRQTGVTVILVEQNARAALAVADYAYVLEMGEIALQAKASELADDPRVIETYLGSSQT